MVRLGHYVALRNDLFDLYICYDELGHIKPTVSGEINENFKTNFFFPLSLKRN